MGGIFSDGYPRPAGSHRWGHSHGSIQDDNCSRLNVGSEVLRNRSDSLEACNVACSQHRGGETNAHDCGSERRQSQTLCSLHKATMCANECHPCFAHCWKPAQPGGRSRAINMCALNGPCTRTDEVWKGIGTQLMDTAQRVSQHLIIRRSNGPEAC